MFLGREGVISSVLRALAKKPLRVQQSAHEED
jgi:hypothetical protein